MIITYWNSYGNVKYAEDKITNHVPRVGEHVHFPEQFECYFRVKEVITYVDDEGGDTLVEVTVVPDDDMNIEVYRNVVTEGDLMDIVFDEDDGNIDDDDGDPCDGCECFDTCESRLETEHDEFEQLQWCFDEDKETVTCDNCELGNMCEAAQNKEKSEDEHEHPGMTLDDFFKSFSHIATFITTGGNE